MKTTSRQHSAGQSLVELALLLPVALLIIVITIDLGRGIYYYSAIYNAAREGARYGIINPDDYPGIDSAARKLAAGLNQSQLDVSTLLVSTDIIEVTVTYNFQLITLLASVVIGRDHLSLSSSSTMLIEK